MKNKFYDELIEAEEHSIKKLEEQLVWHKNKLKQFKMEKHNYLNKVK
jgi:hypothetical protein